jgi:hypothetical protein
MPGMCTLRFTKLIEVRVSLPAWIMQTLELQVCDSHMTGRVEVGTVSLPLNDLPLDGSLHGVWLPLISPAGMKSEGGQVLLDVTYRVSRVWLKGR